MSFDESCATFVNWLAASVERASTGEELSVSDSAPSGRFWLGRLCPEAEVLERGWGDRGERLDPCVCGFRVRVPLGIAQEFSATVRFSVWTLEGKGGAWRKSGPFEVSSNVTFDGARFDLSALNTRVQLSIDDLPGPTGRVLNVSAIGLGGDDEFELYLSNSSDRSDSKADRNLYEVALEVRGLTTTPFELVALPSSFRYDRSVPAYGINCGVDVVSNGITTKDIVRQETRRPKYWNDSFVEPDLRFLALGSDPLPQLDQLLEAVKLWGEQSWSKSRLRSRADQEGWNDEMVESAKEAASEFHVELARLERGGTILKENAAIRRAFQLMNEAMAISARGYDSWRPFQVGFLLANLACLVDESEHEIVDIVWFATGGGKTETYLGLLITAAFFDRLSGKLHGVTAWSRFPLRMLSLQQTERFANAFGAAEIVRRRENIPGTRFSVGYFVGSGATPNRIGTPNGYRKPDPDPDDPTMPSRYQRLSECPLCREKAVSMAFNRVVWRLEHRCNNEECVCYGDHIPFYVVDDDIYRVLPTVVIGTVDKAALLGLQAAMAGFVGPPTGLCSKEGHGFTYATRSTFPNGCLVPGCKAEVLPTPQPELLFVPRFRLQDELHLLRDALGAVDANYERLIDGLCSENRGGVSKVLASSATLHGYEKQSEVLYNRSARVFPTPPPSQTDGFWALPTNDLLRTYAAVAPRGSTLEYAVDQMVTVLQQCVRDLEEEPDSVCGRLGIPVEHASRLVSTYGTVVVYGNTVRDLDAVARSAGSQVRFDGNLKALNVAMLTGQTPFEQVQSALERLKTPEAAFADRIHLVAASSMMSHGVDVDRLNIMIVLGLPLTTAEFIQATARVGRSYPGLVLVGHKIARERDASMYRSFNKYVEQGDRFVEPIPITGKSVRVLERTLPGLMNARLLYFHERRAGHPLTTIPRLRKYVQENGLEYAPEAQALIKYLGLRRGVDDPAISFVEDWVSEFFEEVLEPRPDAQWPSDLFPGGHRVMRSLRDVEEQTRIVGRFER